MDWVKEEINCSLKRAWLTLRQRIKSDLARWEELSGNGDFLLHEKESRLVIDHVELTGVWVAVELTPRGIVIQKDVKPVNDASVTKLTPRVNDKAECRLFLDDGKELEFWQASRLILTSILPANI